MLRRLRTLIRFHEDRRGVAAVEFALVAPVMILAYLGMAELTLGLMAAHRTEHMASTIGDLASQSDNLTAANLTDLWAIGASMLEPFTSAGLKIRVSEITMNSNNAATVTWSSPNPNWTSLSPGTLEPQVTTAQLAVGQSIMMTQVEYDYASVSSPFANFLPGTTKLAYTFYHLPRNGTQVTNIG